MMWKVECVCRLPRYGKDSCQGDLMSRDDNIIMVLPGTRKESKEEVYMNRRCSGLNLEPSSFNDCMHESIKIRSHTQSLSRFLR